MDKVFKERVAHVLDGIENKISSMNQVNFNTAITSCMIQTEINVLCKILDKDSEEFETLLSINKKALEKHNELGIGMVDKLSEMQNR